MKLILRKEQQKRKTQLIQMMINQTIKQSIAN